MRSARPARPRSRVATPSATPQRFQDFSKDFKISRRFQDFTKDFKISRRFQDFTKDFKISRRFQDFTKISRFQKRFQDFSWDFSCSVRDFSKWRTPRFVTMCNCVCIGSLSVATLAAASLSSTLLTRGSVIYGVIYLS